MLDSLVITVGPPSKTYIGPSEASMIELFGKIVNA